MQLRKLAYLAAIAAALSCASATAQPGSPPMVAGAAWRQLTEADLEAAYELLRGSHPGAASELDDQDFQNRLENGHLAAKRRTVDVRNYQGYAAVLAGFAASMGDEHIWANPTLRGTSYRWAGVVMSRRGGKWVVGRHDRREGEPALEGARLIDCDGADAASFAKRQLSFRLSAPIEAQLAAHGGFMLIDDGNPFLPMPRSCTFERDGIALPVELAWRPVATSKLAEALQEARGAAAAGFGIRRVGNMIWVAIERLSEDARPVLQAFARERTELLAAPTIVVDVRGNGGGNSQMGRELAVLIYGEAHVNSVLRGGPACGSAWRASSDNAVHLRRMADTAKDDGTAAYYRGLAEKIDLAVAAGALFEVPLPMCKPNRLRPDLGAEPLYAGRVVLVTDHACFSSCLLMTQDFRALGALHVGEETNAATRYMEVREADLPSGLMRFSTLQKVVVGADADIGPFTPHRVIAQGTGDTAKLEKWVGDLD